MQKYETSRWKLQEARDGWAERGREDTYPKDALEQESGLGHGVTEDVLWAHNLTDKMSFKEISCGIQKESLAWN